MGADIPVIDLFSGPGGLSEGFARHGAFPWEDQLSPERAAPVDRVSSAMRFRIALSIEKDPTARRTLKLRAFTRQFPFDDLPLEYYRVLRGQLEEHQLYELYPDQAAAADEEAWCATLGGVDEPLLDRRIKGALKGADIWCLLGGPPCQAYSLAGRSRNKGISTYKPEQDSRHFLYREYLRIVAEHAPPVFVMENVKGLLSSQVSGGRIFDQILTDLSAPGRAQADGGDPNLEYEVVPFFRDQGKPAQQDGRRFLLRAEEFGVPQARHRIILFGIRRDISRVLSVLPGLTKRAPVPASRVLSGLPRLRAGVSGFSAEESAGAWLATLKSIEHRPWLRELDEDMPEVARAIRDQVTRLKRPARLQQGDLFLDYPAKSVYAKAWFEDPALEGVCNHEARAHMQSDLERYFFAACFAAVHSSSPLLSDFPAALLPKHRNAKDAAKSGAMFADRFRVQLGSRASTTITSHISKDGHYYIHPDPSQCRSFTVREAARLQTFPDNYFFCGPRTAQFHQVGNAVPPLLALQLAGCVADVLAQFKEGAASRFTKAG